MSMTAREISNANNFDYMDFLYYIGHNVDGKLCSISFTGDYEINDDAVGSVIEDYIRLQNAEAEKILIEEQKNDPARKAALAKILITSGFNFDGYTITKYSGYISGDDAIEVDRGGAVFSKDMGQCLTDSLVVIRRNALMELKEAAHALGCNAVIGVDFDYITLDPQTANILGGTTYMPYVFSVTANGNAVIIEKNKTI